MYIIKSKITGEYITNNRFDSSPNIYKSRVFKRKCDAVNSIVQGYYGDNSIHEIIKILISII